MSTALTRADHSSIFTVLTVVLKQTRVGTGNKRVLISLTLNVVQPNDTRTFAVRGSLCEISSRFEVEHTTDNISIPNIPKVVTYSAPATIVVVDLHTALHARLRANETNLDRRNCIQGEKRERKKDVDINTTELK